jgi:hypothetical protein
MTNYFVRAINFQEGGLSIDYALLGVDLRENGLAQNHVIFIPNTDEYAEALDAVIDVAHDTLRRALNDWSRNAPLGLDDIGPLDQNDPDDDDEPGYDNPSERDQVLS